MIEISQSLYFCLNQNQIQQYRQRKIAQNKKMKTKLMFIILILFIAFFQDIQSQSVSRGGGGRGGGGSHGGGSHGGGSHGGGNGGGSRNGGSGGGSFALFFIILCCGIPILCFLCCAMCTGALKNSDHHSRRNSRNSQRSSNSLHSGGQVKDTQTYRKLVSKHNYPISPSLSRQNFQAATNMFNQLISKSYMEKNFKIFTDEGEYFSKANIQFEEDNSSQPYAKNFNLHGEDIIGEYSAKGSIVCGEGGMLVWFMKEYYDRDAAGQTDEWSDLVYESTYFQPDKIQGKWYYEGFEYNEKYSGRWNLIDLTPNQSIQMNNIGERIVMTDNDLTRPLNNQNGW